jgi:D-sedoheptulose 7-phosphate isomerase
LLFLDVADSKTVQAGQHFSQRAVLGGQVRVVRALQYAKEVGAKICGVVGRDGGFTHQVADACVLVPVVNNETITPHTESFQALVWHLLVSHPKLKAHEMRWESVVPSAVGSRA